MPLHSSIDPTSPEFARNAETMRALVGDAEFAGTFAVLMIARLDCGYLRTGAWLYDPRGPEHTVTLEIENGER